MIRETFIVRLYALTLQRSQRHLGQWSRLPIIRPPPLVSSGVQSSVIQ